MLISNLILPYDYILLFIILLVIIFCFIKGFIQSVLGLLTWVGSILITIYSYDSFANFITKQILKIEFFQNLEYQMSILGIIVSVPIIFLISLFILKRLRKIISSDLDKQILGIIFDKLFGILYGLLFSYILITAILILLNKFELESLKSFLNDNSYIISSIDKFNYDYIYNIIDTVTFNDINFDYLKDLDYLLPYGQRFDFPFIS